MTRVLALRRACPNLPIYAILRSSSHAPFLAAAGVPAANVLAVDAVRFGLLANNVIAPGSLPLILNLFSARAGWAGPGAAPEAALSQELEETPKAPAGRRGRRGRRAV